MSFDLAYPKVEGSWAAPLCLPGTRVSFFSVLRNGKQARDARGRFALYGDPVKVFSDKGMTVELPQPLMADENGRFGTIFYAEAPSTVRLHWKMP